MRQVEEDREASWPPNVYRISPLNQILLVCCLGGLRLGGTDLWGFSCTPNPLIGLLRPQTVITRLHVLTHARLT